VPVSVEHLHPAVRVAAPLDAQHWFASACNSRERKVSLKLTPRAQLAGQVLRDPDHQVLHAGTDDVAQGQMILVMVSIDLVVELLSLKSQRNCLTY